MTVSNGGFETQAPAGPVGSADKWTVSEVFTAETYAEFAANPGKPDTSGQETFEAGWYPPLAQTFVAALVEYFDGIDPAFFDAGTQSFEDFEGLWGAVLQAIAGTQDAMFTPGGAVEDMEDGWGSAPQGAGGVTLTFAVFDTGTPGGFEDFENEWGTVLAALPPPSFAFFSTNLALSVFEAFEGVRFDLDSLTVVVGTNTLVRTAHGLALGDPITLRNEGGRLPDGLQGGTQYFVFTVTANDFQVRAVLGGAAITINDNGFGAHFIVHSPERWWIDEVNGV